MGDVTSPIP